AVAYQHVREEPQPPSNFDPEITPNMDAIVLKALVKDPDYRYQSADEMRADIEACLDGQPVAAAAAMGAVAYGGGYGNGYGGYAPEDQPTTALRQADPAGQTSMLPPINPDDGGYGYDDRPDRRRQKKSNTSTILLVLAGILVLVGAILIGRSIFDTKEEPQQVTIPSLVGHTLKEAEGSAKNAGVKVTQSGSERCEQPKGKICSQTPAADGVAKMTVGETISVVVSEGAPQIEVPDVVEKSQETAEKNLKDKGFKVVVEQEESDEDPGTVLRQDPAGGSKAEQNSPVKIVVAKQEKSQLPDVTGREVNQAIQQLNQLGFTNIAQQQEDSQQPAGTVTGMTPSGGTNQPKDVQITLKVSKGPQQTQTTIPAGLSGKTFDEVKAQLEALGLVVQQQGSNSGDARVFGTNPPEGSPITTGQTVTVFTAGGNNNGGNNGGFFD
ncbi:PASTA domain-containing protein, partial [Streptomyces sp. NPDC047981]|uniref:Stk1 family PASTA domain-containing Ser/Thr kinase n=1 Tax=Streptomyces sp. NPDC047981 TaxID=3154610 RepID=UPI00342A72A0